MARDYLNLVQYSELLFAGGGIRVSFDSPAETEQSRTETDGGLTPLLKTRIAHLDPKCRVDGFWLCGFCQILTGLGI